MYRKNFKAIVILRRLVIHQNFWCSQKECFGNVWFGFAVL